MSFSVIIPTCDRPAALDHCLRALPSTITIIVTDDSRGPQSRVLIEQEFPHVTWVAGPRRGPAANRNNGASHACTEWLAFTDDDCLPQPGWLDALASLARHADVIEGCTLAPGARDDPFEEHVENRYGGVLWSCNLAVRRDVFDVLGGFDEDFTEPAGEDMEFAWRVQQRALRARFAPTALVYHPPRAVGWPGIFRRTRMRRWMVLYRIKTGQASRLPAMVTRELLDTLRGVVGLARRPDRNRWRRQVFSVIWSIVTLPYALPAILLWEGRFRRMLEERSSVAAPKCA